MEKTSPPSQLWCGLFGGLAAAGLVGALTLRRNPHIHQQTAEAVILVGYFLLAGLFAGLLAGLAGRLMAAVGRGRPFSTAAAGGLVAFAAPLYCLLLPDVGIAQSLLSDFLFSASRLRQLLFVAILCGACALLGLVVHRILGLLQSRRLAPVVLALPLLAFGDAVLMAGEAPPAPQTQSSAISLQAPTEPPPTPVILLCIDGADLDDVLLPAVAAGELPAFGKLLEESTWGPLETLEPTLSAVVWTTLITGKEPADHGIRSFISFRLPGLRPSIEEFPIHTGLNYKVFPWLEKLPTMPPLQIPYSSNMRRAEALWSIVDRFYPVGAYQWLITWPAEPVNGFNVAGGLGWIQLAGEFREQIGQDLARRSTHPPELADEVRRARRRRQRQVTEDDRRAFLPAGALRPGDARLAAIEGLLADPTVDVLPDLMARFTPRLTVASFYPVDPLHHFFAANRGDEGPFGEVVDAGYRLTDQRLGELMAQVGDEVHWIVLSDHGWDFERNHHTWAPAGMFFARGPAFEAGRRIDGMSVYDIAPLVLHLLRLPQPQDMPGARRGAFLEATSADYRRQFPRTAWGEVATYERGRGGDSTPVPSPRDEELRETMRSLGYIQ
ncbi:MAG: alkaline phosphatase family protein [Acidobacteriota bacterium]